MAKIKICREEGCNDAATTAGFCRLHYLKRWKQIKDRERNEATKRLNRYIEKVCKENPEDFVDVIRRDLGREDFEESVVKSLDFGEEAEISSAENDNEDEIERIIRKLKIEEGF